MASGVGAGRPLSWLCGRCGGPWGGPPLRLPGLLAALPGVVAGRDRGGGRSSCGRGPVSVRVSPPTA